MQRVAQQNVAVITSKAAEKPRELANLELGLERLKGAAARREEALEGLAEARVILDQPGAERLLGRGDMLYQAPDAPSPARLQGVFVSDQEIQKLLAAAKKLSPVGGLRPWTYHCLFGLLVVGGLRISEAIKLERQDVDLEQGLLTIRRTKFNKSRLVPLHDSTRDVLVDYARRRNRWLPKPASLCFLVNDHGRCLEISAVHRTFYDLSRQTGLRGPADHTGPRIHDFRHAFAVNALLRWYRAGADVEAKLPLLATYLGHGSVVSTHYYLHFIEPLRAAASERFANRYGELVSPLSNAARRRG